MKTARGTDIRGFTLIEMMVVIVIAGILATAAIFAMNSGAGKVRGAAFRLRGDLNLARSEAVNRNRQVLVEFLPGRPGYVVCIDSDADNVCTDEAAANVIKDVSFATGVFFYPTVAVGGPTVEADADGGGWGANTDNDGVRLGSDTDNSDDSDNFLSFGNDGIPSTTGTIYLYYSDQAFGAIGYGPFAVDLGSTGRARILRWNNGQWLTR